MASIALSSSLAPALAQTAATTPAAAATASPTAAPTVVITTDGMVDAYYTYNFTNSSHGFTGTVPGNPGLGYNTTDDSFTLGLAEESFTATLGSTSAHLVLAYGQTADLSTFDPANGTGFAVEQAYVSYNPGMWTFNAGKFVTWMGNEVVESKSNWNYSRSLLFNYTIPVWHTGISANYAPSSTFNLTGYATDGDNTTTASPLGKTYGLQVNLKPSSIWNFYLNGIAGPGMFSGVAGNPVTAYGAARYVGEAIVDYTPDASWSFALDAEYGAQDLVGSSNAPTTVAPTLGNGTSISSATFKGFALYGRYQAASDWAFALRLEELSDDYGILGIYGVATPSYSGKGPYDNEAREITLTIEHNLSSNLLFRLEGRGDMAYTGGSAYGSGADGPFADGDSTQWTGTAGAVFSY